MKTDGTTLSVVIPTLGTCPHLRGLLERLQRQTFSPERGAPQVEVLVVANLPKQELRSIVSSMDRSSQIKFEYLETAKLGVNLARNKGLERAKGEIVLFLDDDAILDDLAGAGERFLDRHIEKHLAHPDASAIGGPYRLVDRHSEWDEAYHFIATRWLHQNLRDGNSTTQLLGGNLSVKRDVFERGIRFDEAIPYGGAETGFCLKLQASGLQLFYFSDLAIGHAPDLTRRSFCKKAYLQGAGAKWRALNLSSNGFVHVNQLWLAHAPTPTIVSSKLVELYRQCFDFGWSSNPFRNQLISNNQVSFNFWKFLSYRFRLFLIQTLIGSSRSKIRELYAATRSIWISAKN